MKINKDELMQWLKPSKPTEDELASAMALMHGDYEVYAERLNMIVQEAREVYLRIGQSQPLLAGDMVVGVHNAQGDLITACLGTFLHTVTAQLPIKYVIKNFKDNPNIEVNEGDIFVTNEANYGGIHNPDVIAFMPVFYKGEIIAWTTSGNHTPETGGCDPGGFCTSAKSKHDEGLKLPPVKLVDRGKLREDWFEMILNFGSRSRRIVEGDFRARLTACDRARRRILELAEEKGAGYVKALFRRLLVDGEEGAKKKISRWNDGTYRSVVFLDSTGVAPGLWRMHLTAHKVGDHINFDFTGTSPEQEGFWNAMPWAMVSVAAQYLYAHPFHDLPTSSGVLAAFDWNMPAGTIVNASPDAATSGAVLVAEFMGKLLPPIFSSMMYSSKDDKHLSGAPIGLVFGCIALAGITQRGLPFADLSSQTMNGAGSGARMDKDGIDSGVFHPALYASGSDHEEMEIQNPVIHNHYRHIVDSCGHGKYRGGSAIEVGYIIYGSNVVHRVKFFSGGRVVCGNGVFGGYPSFSSSWLSIDNTNMLDMIKSGKDVPKSVRELVTSKVVSGDYSATHYGGPDMHSEGFFSGHTQGGCGYGDALEREPQSVVDDVRYGFLTDWSARNIYKVAYNPENWIANLAETQELRRLEREDRIRRGTSFAEFESKWLEKRPASDLMYYGSWPNAEPNRPIIRL